MYARTDNIVSFAPVDAKYADVDDDNIPDLAIGRLPVRTTEELANVIAQTINYDNKTYHRTAVFGSDATDQRYQYSFADDIDMLVDKYLASWQVERAHIDELGLEGARQRIIDTINQGVAIAGYIGHSGPTEWSFQGLLNNLDVAQLNNVDRPTVITQWGCWNTYFVAPTEDSLGHTFMLNGDRGAASVVGASTLTEASAERDLADLLLARLIVPGTRIGDAILDAKRVFALSNPQQLDVILGWTQLGDPALIVEP
jgi:hypothetical protein